jgi:hypothetical protein
MGPRDLWNSLENQFIMVQTLGHSLLIKGDDWDLGGMKRMRLNITVPSIGVYHPLLPCHVLALRFHDIDNYHKSLSQIHCKSPSIPTRFRPELNARKWNVTSFLCTFSSMRILTLNLSMIITCYLPTTHSRGRSKKWCGEKTMNKVVRLEITIFPERNNSILHSL